MLNAISPVIHRHCSHQTLAAGPAEAYRSKAENEQPD